MNHQRQDSIASLAPLGQTDPPPRPISHRTILGGLAAFTGIAALGGGFALWKYRRSHTALYTYTAQNENIYTVAWSPDGNRIASGGSSQQTDQTGSIHMWDALTGQHVVIYHDRSDTVGNLAWSPNGQLLASASQNDLVVHVFRASTGAILLTYSPDAKGASFTPRAVAWSSDSKRIASAGENSYFAYNLQSWDALTGSQVMTYEHSFPALDLWRVAWSPDGRYLASVGTVDGKRVHGGERDFLIFSRYGMLSLAGLFFSVHGSTTDYGLSHGLRIINASSLAAIVLLRSGIFPSRSYCIPTGGIPAQY